MAKMIEKELLAYVSKLYVMKKRNSYVYLLDIPAHHMVVECFKIPPFAGNYYLTNRNYYILGDSAYSCSSHLITLYRDMKLSPGRVIIEHSFGILKQRFRQLYYCKIRGIEHMCHFIRACCVLHNIAGEDDIKFNEETLLPVQEEYRGSVRGNAIRDAVRQEIEIDV